MISQRPPPSPRQRWDWRGPKARSLAWQIALVALVFLVAWVLLHNTLVNMRLRGIQSGFDFLFQPAGFAIGEGLFAFDSGDAYWKAFLAGLANTLRVAIVGIVLCTVLGTLIGIGRLSRNYLARKLCAGYVELFRNIPLLVQLLLGYLLLTEWLPDIDQAIQPTAGVFFSKNGLAYPLPMWDSGLGGIFVGLMAGVLVAAFWIPKIRLWTFRSGLTLSMVLPTLGIVCAGAALGWIAGGATISLDFPIPDGMNVVGGGSVSPEFLAVTAGLSLYTAAFVAESVRAGILSVPQGQVEAAHSIGLTRIQALRFIILPQALRATIPPLTNQYLNLTKNSSLAVAVGYPDLVSIANTTINQSGRAVECIAVLMAVYLLLSLTTAALMHWYDARKSHSVPA